MENDELATYLASFDRDSCYRIDAVYKQGPNETTQRVYYVGKNGSELGPFVRKYINLESGMGTAYEEVLAAQERGVRFVHLPRVVECYRSGDRLVVVMEHLAGKTLGACVGECSDAGERLALVRRVFGDLCDAVSELHERGTSAIIHRDLKPSNVMVAPAGVFLVDLGIARVFKDGGEQDTTHFGTRAYAPPEQFGFGQTSVQSDVYALGMLLFFCLTGHEAAPADRDAGFADDSVPAGLARVVAQATELDPGRRYASVRAFKDALEREAGGARPLPPAPPVAMPPVAPVQVPRRPLLSRVSPTAGVLWNAFVLLFVAALLGISVDRFMNPAPQDAGRPLWSLGLMYFGFMDPLFLILGYLVLDRRRLRQRFPRLARFSVRQETRWGLAACVALFLLWLAVTLFVGWLLDMLA